MLFSWKRNKSKENILQVIKKIEELQKDFSSKGMGKITRLLDQVLATLDSNDLVLTDDKKTTLLGIVGEMKSHSTKDFDLYLQKKCEHLLMIINGDVVTPQKAEAIQNDNKLYELLGETSALTEQIGAIDEKMKAALGTNKNLWLMLNTQKRTLQQTILVKTKNYQTLLEQQSSIQLAAEVRQSKEEAEAILRSCESFDVEEFEANAEYASMAAEEVSESSQRIQNAFEKNFGVTVDASSEYEKALEEKLLEEAKEPPIAKEQVTN